MCVVGRGGSVVSLAPVSGGSQVRIQLNVETSDKSFTHSCL